MTPTDRKYTKEHEWLKETDEGMMLGITDHAQQELGDIVFVELPAVGDTFAAGESFAIVESIKAVSNIYTPVGGEVVRVNSKLENNPELINETPYEAHIAVFRVDDMAGAELLSQEEYDAFVAAEA